MDPRERITLQPLELDALREVGNMGAGRAATALSQMLGRTVTMDVPAASVLPLEQLSAPLGGPEALVAATYFRVHGDAPGRLLVVLGEASLGPVVGALLGLPSGQAPALDATAQSAIKELGNILCSAYLNALADFLGFPSHISDARCGAPTAASVTGLAAKRACWRSRAARTRVRISAEPSAEAPPRSSLYWTAGTSMWMSMRSSKGPLTLLT